MISALIALFLIACGSRGAPQSPHRAIEHPRTWIEVNTEFATIEIPSGWDINVLDQPHVSADNGFFLIPERGAIVAIYGLATEYLDEVTATPYIESFSERLQPDTLEARTKIIDFLDGRAHCASAQGMNGDYLTAACLFWPKKRQEFIPLAYIPRLR